MTAQQQQLTSAQQKILYPKPLNATGKFNAKVDDIPLDVQTKTLTHDFDRAFYGITGRHADNSVTVKEFYIQLPDNIEVDKIFRLEDSELTKIRVWYTVKSPTDHYAVECINGILTVRELNHKDLKIVCAVIGDTNTDPHGNTHNLNIELNLQLNTRLARGWEHGYRSARQPS